VLARNISGQPVVIAVEGKVDEPFGPLVGEWRKQESAGKKERLRFLCKVLGLETGSVDALRYQLLHRTAAAVLEAERFGASAAIMLVHSFSPEQAGFQDYALFAKAIGADAREGAVATTSIKGPPLFLAWVTD